MKSPSNIFIALDFETTGLAASEEHIVEIGAVRFNYDNQEVDVFSQLVDPGVAIPPEAIRIHGITDEMVRGKPSPRKAWNQFLDWAGEHTCLIAHNAEYEANFVRFLYKSESLPSIKFVDTLTLAKRRLKDQENYKLGTLVPSLDEKSHRAVPDAKACVELFLRIAATYKDGKIPLKTNLIGISEFPEYRNPNAPSDKQLGYIKRLGGDITTVSTKQEASAYIDRLKEQNDKDSVESFSNIQESGKSHFPWMAVGFVLIAGVVFSLFF